MGYGEKIIPKYGAENIGDNAVNAVCRNFALFAIISGFLFFPFIQPANAQKNLRGWHKNGQTFLVWEETSPRPYTFDVYKSKAPISNLEKAELIGRVFWEDWSGLRLKIGNLGASWIIPDEGDGTYKLNYWNEGLFVYTAHEAFPEYFAVVKHEAISPEPNGSLATVGPIEQSLDPIQCYSQYTGTTHTGSDYTLWAFWLDGRQDQDDSRDGFPIMGNATANGTAALFAVAEPLSRESINEPVPVVIVTHGTGDISSYNDFISAGCEVVYFDVALQDAKLVSIDDNLYVLKEGLFGQSILGQNTQWFGYWNEFDRFNLAVEYPPDDALIVDYTVRKVKFITDWVIENEGVDEHRISFLGYSGGASGANYLVRLYPEMFSAVANFVPVFTNWENPYSQYLLGTSEQNLQTNIFDGMGITDLHWPTFGLEENELPFSKYISGKNENTELWSIKIAAYAALNELRTGVQIFWDERMHASEYDTAHWNLCPRLRAQELTRYRNDQSFPAFSNDDSDPSISGRQPDMGNGNPEDGDPWGTWGGFFDWDTGSVIDTPDLWSVTLYMIYDSDFENDIAPYSRILTDITIRRAQQFLPESGSSLRATLTRISDDELLYDALSDVTSDFPPTFTKVPLTKDPSIFEVTFFRDDDDDDDNDSDDDNDVNDDGEDGHSSESNNSESDTACCGN